MKLIAFVFVLPWFLIALLKICQLFTKIDNFISSKWYQSLDDKSDGSICSTRVKFNVDLSFCVMRRLYSWKFKKGYAYRQRKNRKELKGAHKRNFENSRNFTRDFKFG